MNDGGAVPALLLLKEGIAALAQADAPRLERLAEEAGRAVLAEGDQGAAREQYAALEVLLGLTRRNQRVLRGESRGMYGRD
jgi:hypothetical protein